MLERSDGALLALFTDTWRSRSVERNHSGFLLERLLAGHIEAR